MHREQITDALWPDLDTKSAANNLHRALHFARGVLETTPPNTTPRYLQRQGALLALCPEGPLWVDVQAFEEAAATARHSREPAAYRAAVELYSGELLPEDRYEEWTQEKREELRQLRLALLVELAGLNEEREEYEPAIEALRQVLAEEPAKEEAHQGLMRLYAASGRRRRAIAQYHQLEETLSKDIGTEPEAATRRLYEEILANRHPSRPKGRASKEPADSSRHNLPNPRTSFVGREKEAIGVKRSLAMTGLLTLTGSGGCGKTRLALEVARDLVGTYPGGVWLVELASLSDPALVPHAVAAALGVREAPGRSLAETLVEYLRPRKILLVLDNCEHLIGACARLVDALLDSCSQLRVLATSREALSVAGEVGWPVLPLAVPEVEDLPSAESLAGYGAVRLFVERARSKLPAFELTRENAGAVAEVCRKLDGIPLAIELAAARVTALAVGQVAERLADSLDLLTSGSRTADPRHRTLRATLQWSYELLSEPERKLFCRLSVFAGGWTLGAAEVVGEGGGVSHTEVLDLLSKLVDKSLVMAEAGAEGELRYRMLEPVRQYGWERLEESGETEQVQERHAGYSLALVERVEPALLGVQPVPWLERLEREYDNVRAALSWCLDEEDANAEERAEMGLRLAAALGRFWVAQGLGEGRRWLEKGLAKSSASPTPVRAKALIQAGFDAVYEGDPGAAIALLEEGLALYKEMGDRSGVAFAIGSLGHAVVHSGNRERVMTLREEAEALLREALDRRAAADLLTFLGLAAESETDFEQMEARLKEALALRRELGDIRGVAMCLTPLGMTALEQGDPGRASALFEEDLRLLLAVRDKVGIVYGLLGMAAVNALRGQPARAARLWGAVEALREAIGHLPTTLERARYDHEGYLAAARAGLDEASFDAAWSEGRAMSPEQAIEYALSAEDASLQAVRESRAAPPDPLTRREREVATLIGRGFTNRQVAEELAITERTVEAHVSKILRKLKLRSRTQIATWTIQQGPLSADPIRRTPPPKPPKGEFAEDFPRND